MTIGEAWRSVRQDPQWKKKAGIGVLVSLIPYLGAFLVMGYYVNYAHAVARRTDGGRLPDWNALGDHARTALKAFVVSLAYGLPMMVLTMPLSFAFAIGIAASAEESSAMPVVLVSLAFGVGVLAIILISVPILYAGLAALIATAELEAPFALRDVWERTRRHARLLTATVGRMIGVGFLSALPAFGVGAILLAAAVAVGSTGENAAGLAIGIGVLGYLLFIVLTIAASAVSQLVGYRLLAEYVAVAYADTTPPGAEAAA